MKTTKITQRILSLVFALCMVVSLFQMPLSANAATTFNYVSLGASNTNGYGMRGYITEEELNAMLSGQVSKDEVNVYGYQRKPEGAYPDLIRDYYTDVHGDVNIDQLAISSMRVEELRILLDDSYMGDDYSSWRFTGSDGWFLSAEEGGIPALRSTYKTSIANADLITVDIGWNNFGVYVCNQLVDYMANGRYKWTTDVSSIFPTDAEDAAALEAKAVIGEYIKANVGEGDMADALTDIFAYSILGYIHNFDIVMEKIYELNPDAKVVVLGIQNLLHGVVVELNGTTVPLGDLFGNFVNMANYYVSSCSPFQSQYQYTKAGSNEHVSIFLDEIKYYDGDAEHLNQNIKDCFDYYDNNLFIQTRVDHMAAELIKQMVAEELGENMLDTALSVLGCEDWLEVVAKGKAGELPTDLMGKNYQELFDSKYWPALYAAYDTLAEVVKVVANFATVKADDLIGGSLNISDAENALKKALEDEVTENAVAAANGAEYTVDIEKIMPDSNSEIVAAMYIRYYMGNSFFAHPNGTGHAEIKDAVINVINNPESEKDQALSDYLKESVHEIHKLLCEAVGHNWDNGTVTKEPTETEPGTRTYQCINCGTTKTEEIPCEGTEDSSIQRIYGQNRIETAIAVAEELKSVLNVEKFDSIILAAGGSGSDQTKFADALSGSYLATSSKAPILLYTKGDLSAQNLAFIQENLSANGTIYLLGGNVSIPAEVEEALKAEGYNTKRLGGTDRYDTNLIILQEAGIADADEILVASGRAFADSLSASATGLPIMLVNGTKTELTDAQIEFLQSVKGKKITILGGTAAVTAELEAAINEAADTEADRIFGNARENTSAMVAQKYFADADTALIAYSKMYPDGLAGGVLANALKAPLLLTKAGSESIANEYIEASGISSGYVLGGTAVLTDDTARAVFGLSNDVIISTK